MRIGSGVQSASEVFGKQQNNSKTYVAENEAFSQTSVKVYLKTDDMLFSGGNGTGLSFYIKSVSYTHLDVYKRQPEKRSFI